MFYFERYGSFSEICRKDKKLKNTPVWEFLEIITFSELVNFYELFAKEYELKEEIKNIFILREIGKLRNTDCSPICIHGKIV